MPEGLAPLRSLAVIASAAVLNVFSILALQVYEKPPQIPTGQEDCFEVFERIRCGEMFVRANIDLGNPAWVTWVQKNDWFTLMSVLVGFWGLYELGRLFLRFIHRFKTQQATNDGV